MSKPSPLPPELVAQYIDNRRTDLSQLQAALAAQDLEQFLAIGHRLKGSGPAYGFAELGGLGQQMQDAAAREDLATLQQLVGALDQWLATQGCSATGGGESDCEE